MLYVVHELVNMMGKKIMLATSASALTQGTSYLGGLPAPSSSRDAACPEGLIDLAKRAISRSHELDKPVLLRTLVEIEAKDPWSVFAHQWDRDHGVVWSDGRTGFTLAAVGALQRFSWSEGAIEKASLHLTRERQRLVQGWFTSGQPSLLELPLAFLSFSFDDRDAGGSDPWRGWPKHQLVVPETMVVRWAGTPTMAVVATEVHSKSSAEEVALELTARRFGLERGAKAQDRCEDSKQAPGRLESPEYLRLAPSPQSAEPLRPLLSHEGQESKAAWCRRVLNAQRAFAPGGLEKVVVARRSHFHAPRGFSFDPWSTVEDLRSCHPDAFVFGLTAGDGRWFTGATPELLARVSSGRFEGHALAGTVASSDNPELDRRLADDLMRSGKNLHEHTLVLDEIRSVVEDHCTETVVACQPKVRRLTQMQHLETAIRARVRQGSSLLDIVAALHPTPAVGGAPREAARRYLREHEKLHRGYYASPVGWVGDRGEGTFAVALRSALLSAKEAVAFAGAGIVADSKPGVEWDETELKLATIAQALVLSPDPR